MLEARQSSGWGGLRGDMALGRRLGVGFQCARAGTCSGPSRRVPEKMAK